MSRTPTEGRYQRRFIKESLTPDDILQNRRHEENAVRRDRRYKYYRAKYLQKFNSPNSSDSGGGSYPLLYESSQDLCREFLVLSSRFHSLRASGGEGPHSVFGMFLEHLSEQLKVCHTVRDADGDSALRSIAHTLNELLLVGHEDLLRLLNQKAQEKEIIALLEQFLRPLLSSQANLETHEQLRCSDASVLIHKDLLARCYSGLINVDTSQYSLSVLAELKTVLNKRDEGIGADAAATARLPQAVAQRLLPHLLAALVHPAADCRAALSGADEIPFQYLLDLFFSQMNAVISRAPHQTDATLLDICTAVTYFLSEVLSTRDAALARRFLDRQPAILIQRFATNNLNGPYGDLLAHLLVCFKDCAVADARRFREGINDDAGGCAPFLSTICAIVRHSATEKEDTPEQGGQGYSIDTLEPALLIIIYAAVGVLPSHSAGDESMKQSEQIDCKALDVILQDGNLQSCLPQLLDHQHRSVMRDAAELVSIAAASPHRHHAMLVLPYLPILAMVFHKLHEFDVKREFAKALLHLALNHNHEHLQLVVEAQPSPVESFLDLMGRCRFDQTSLMIALDFLDAVIRFTADGRRTLFQLGFVDVAEELLNRTERGPVLKYLTQMITTYFDNIDDLEDDDCNT